MKIALWKRSYPPFLKGDFVFSGSWKGKVREFGSVSSGVRTRSHFRPLISVPSERLKTVDEAQLAAFICPSCSQKFRLNPKGNDRIYSYFCGKEAKIL